MRPSPPCSSHLSLSRERERERETQPLNQLPIKPPNHGIAVNNETIQLRGAGKKKEHEKRKLRQTQAITQPTQPSRPTLLVTPPEAEGPRKQKWKQKKAERLDSGGKDRPRQRAEEMEWVGTDLTLNAPKHHRFKKESDLRYRFNKEFGCDCCAWWVIVLWTTFFSLKIESS
jgi:hypothetical protein